VCDYDALAPLPVSTEADVKGFRAFIPPATTWERFRSISRVMSIFARALSSPGLWWCIGLASAAAFAVSARHSMNQDGLSYLDLASEAAQSGPAGLLNGYWSPGYPALLGLAFALFHPSPDHEFPLIHFVNFLIFALALFAFHFFLRSWLLSRTATEPTDGCEDRGIIPFAFGIFLWFMLKTIGVGTVTPDLGVAAIVFLAAGITCRLSLPGASNRHYVALGLALGLGYYAKAAMFPLGLFFFGGLLLFVPSNHVSRQRQKLLLSLVVFLLVAAPLATILSSRAGRLTFGEAGRLNYVWYVNRLPRFIGWTGGSADVYGSPQHSPRTLMGNPLILEFDGPIKGTFPLWYDPSYWYAGAKARFDPHQQIAALKVAWRTYRGIFHEDRLFFVGAAALLCLLAVRKMRFSDVASEQNGHGVKRAPQRAGAFRESWLVIWPVMAMSMYAFVHVERRFLGAFLVLLWLWIYSTLMSRASKRFAVRAYAAVAGLVVVLLMLDLAKVTSHEVRHLVHSVAPDYKTAAIMLTNLGIRGGDRLAVVGYPFDPYYARYARLHLVAYIPSADSFWSLSTPELEAMVGRLTRIGVKAVVAKNRPSNSTIANWRDVKLSGQERFSILLLSEALPKSPVK
jgi:hypothetical protein